MKKKKIKKNKPTKKPKRKWWKKLLTVFIILFAIGIFAVFGFCLYIVTTTGEFDPNALANQDRTIIYDSENNIIETLGMEQRESIKYDDLPQVLIDAIIATEDSRFFQHNGVDTMRFLKASFQQLMGNSDAGGASTITMQVVKNNLTSTEQTITRKFKDVYLAVFFMEKKYTKEEILEFYVNDSYLGGPAYGVEEASKYYFGKSVSDLSLPEAAIIAGLFQAPSGYNPYNYPEKTETRMNTVLNLMVRHGYITEEEEEIAKSIDITSLLVGQSDEQQYQGFIDYVVNEVEEKTGNDPNMVSMEIHTTMVPSIQDGLNTILSGEGYTWPDEYIQAGISVVDVKTGAISALGTGRNRDGKKLFSYATSAKRQPGSTAKPIFAYGPGFEYDNFSTYQLFVDEAWSYSDGTEIGNWDGNYRGLMTLRQALSISRNIPALKAFQTVQNDVGNDKIKEFVNKLGMNLDNVYESYSLGGLSEGVTTLQMAAAYAAFGNGGYYTEPYSVTSITYRTTGETVDFEAERTQAMKDSTAYLVTNVLEYAANYGFSGGTSGYSGTVAVKTGTSNYSEEELERYNIPEGAAKDLWSVAYTPEYSIALWYGYDETSSEHYLSGASAPKDNLMAAIMEYIPVCTDEFTIPSSVTASQVEFGTWPAELPSENTPSDMILTEYFITGTEPTETSQRYATLPAVTNLKAEETSSGITLTWNYDEPEVTQEDYLESYYNQSVFGNSGSKLLQERLSSQGELGYGIYLQDSAGNLIEIGFTTNKTYTYQPVGSGNINLSVKAEYRNYKTNASDPTTVQVTANSTNNNDDEDNNEEDNDLHITMTNTINASVNNYIEEEITITYQGENVTDDCQINYSLETTNGTRSFTSAQRLEEAVNRLEAGTYQITYRISYEGITATRTRTVRLT